MQFNSLLDPMFNYIDNGRLFRQPFMWLYYLLGVLFAIGIFIGIIELFGDMKRMDASGKFGIILDAIIMLAACVFSVIYWFKRAPEVGKIVKPGSRFVAIPAVANLIRCLGEYTGILIGVGGFLLMLIAVLTEEYLGFSFGHILLVPVVGFIIVVISRCVSESMLAMVSIANDTHELATFNPVN